MYDGISDNASLIGKFCGTSLPPKLQSSGRSVRIAFKTDDSGRHVGFQTVYYATKLPGTERYIIINASKLGIVYSLRYVPALTVTAEMTSIKFLSILSI